MHSANLERLRELSAARSSLPQLASLTTPVFMLQGRRDFAFGLEQAIEAFARDYGVKWPRRWPRWSTTPRSC
jgi:hypothetical protein